MVSRSFRPSTRWLLLHCLLIGGLWRSAATLAQAPAWQLAVALEGETSAPLVGATAVDSLGDVYLVGSFYETITLGGWALTSAGRQDGFVAKWSRAQQRFVWAHRLGGTENDVATAITVNRHGVYVAGAFSSPRASVGSIVLSNNGRTGDSQPFVTKLLEAGGTSQFGWAHAIGVGQAGIAAIAVHDTNLYLAGSYFGPLRLANTTLPNANPPALAPPTCSSPSSWMRARGPRLYGPSARGDGMMMMRLPW